jgi:glutamyl-tRNA synthetase
MMKIDKSIIEAYAAENALNYGKAQTGTVLGKIISENPELKEDVKGLMVEIQSIVSDVNKKNRTELESLAKTARPKKIKEKHGGLPDLLNVGEKVVLRFAPNPSGPLHIGHARTAILNDAYAKKYDGSLILRVEDTDPKRVDIDAYAMIEEDLKWLGVVWNKKVIQSKRLSIYKDIAYRLLKRGNAYICSCGQEKFKGFKDNGVPCPCREKSVEETLMRWDKMRSGDAMNYAVMLKTDITHKNPAMRDFPLMRPIEVEHPSTHKKWDVYPLMNFSVVVDDHFLELTHVIRGKDHIVNTERQLFIYKYLNWKPPEFIHNGLMRMHDTNLKTSIIKQGVSDGTYDGWDDVRLGTLSALRRRGIQSDAIRNMFVSMGCAEVDVTFKWENLYAENKKLIEKDANRYFFIPDPVEMWVRGLPKELERVKLPLHPDEDRGMRTINIKRDGDETRFFIAKSDAELKKGENIRLKNLCNVRIDETMPLKASYLETKDLKVDKKIQWLPEEVIGCELMSPDGRVAGFCEENCKNLHAGDVIQFERIGFVRVDDAGNEIICYFAHR